MLAPTDQIRNLNLIGITTNMTRLRLLAVVLAANLMGPTVSLADEHVQAASAEFANHASVIAQEAKSTIVRAISGDTDAMLKLGTRYLLPAVLALIALMIGYLMASFVGRVVGTAFARKIDITLGKFIGKVLKNIVLVMVALGLLGYFGVDVTSFAAILAATGFAIGMALQGTLSNFAAGVMLLVFRPFKVGDYIIVEGTQGTVEEIDLFTTRLNSRDNRHLIVPNSRIFGSTIENTTRNTYRRVEVNVGVDYSADTRVTRSVLTAAIQDIPGTSPAPAPEAYLMDLGDSSVNWQLRVWCNPSVYADVRQRVTEAAKTALEQSNIGIPFPQLDLHFRNLDQVITGGRTSKAA